MAFDADMFEQLLAAQWAGPGFSAIQFPVTKFKTSLAHDLVQHKYWKRNGARIEDTGVAPIRHTFSLPMLNTLARGKAEKWPDPLYPNHWRILYQQAQRQATGVLTHPELGELPCKLETLDTEWDAQRRAGVEVEISFIETLQDFDSPNPVGLSPIQKMTNAGANLDSSYDDLGLLAPTLPVFRESFADFARKLQSIGDTQFAAAYRVKGFADGMIYRANAVIESLDRAADATTWPARDAAERIKDAGHAAQRASEIAFTRTTFFYTTLADITLAELSQTLKGAPVDEMMRLNPRIAAAPVVKKGTVVRYTAPR
jgi:prophage DNA circulation protein